MGEHRENRGNTERKQRNKIRGNKIYSRKAAKSAKEEEGLFRRGLLSRKAAEIAKEEEGLVL